jgi:hypothetical protein
MQPYYGVSMFVVLYLLFTQFRLPGRVEYTLASIGSFSLWVFLLHYTILELYTPLFSQYISLPGIPAFILYALLSVLLSLAGGWVFASIYGYLEAKIRTQITF